MISASLPSTIHLYVTVALTRWLEHEYSLAKSER